MSQPLQELDVVASFRRQLAELPEQSPNRRGMTAAAVTALATVPLVVVFVATGGSSNALAITRDATTLELRIADASADATQMTRELNNAGIRGRVLVVPVAPQLAGRWVVTGETAAKPATCIPPQGTPSVAETVRLNDIENAGAVLRIPIARVRESAGTFVLVAGRDPRAGEQPLNVDSPEAVQREVLEPVLGPPPSALPPC